MKKLKKVLNTFLIFILISLICILVISINLKTVIVDGIIKETIKTEIINKEYKEKNTIKEEIDDITDDPKIKEILNSKEIQELIDKYLNIVVDGLLDEDNLDDVELEKDILKYIKDNKEIIEEKTNTKIDDKTIEKVMEMKEAKQLSKKLINTINEQKKTITKTEKEVLKGYKTFVSIEFQLIILGLILVDIALIFIINKSLIITIKSVATSSIISGIFIIIMSIITKLIVINYSILKTFHMKSLLLSGIGVLIIGILLMFVYKIVRKRENKDDISKVSQGE